MRGGGYVVKLLDSSDSSVIYSSTVSEYIDLSYYAKKTGYKYTIKDSSGNQLSDFYTKVSADSVFYVTYTPIQYTITFAKSSDNVTGELPSDISCTYDVEVTLPVNNLTYSTLKSDGWKSGSYDSKSYSNGQTVKNLSSTDGDTVTLYSAFRSSDYKLSFYKSSTYSYEYLYKDSLESVSADEVPTASEEAGYDFAGWYKSDDTSETLVDFTTYTVTKDETFEAKYIPKSYKVTFVTEFGTAPEELTVKYGDYIYISGYGADTKYTLSKEHYNFEGWYDAEGNKVTKLSPSSTDSFEDITLSAKWSIWTATILFNANGGDGAYMENISAEYGKEITLPDCTYYRYGYSFKGWRERYNSTETIGKYTWTGTRDKDTVYIYAIWEKLPVTLSVSIKSYSGSTDDVSLVYDTELGALKASAEGIESYSWYKDGEEIANATSSTLSAYRLGTGLHTVMVVAKTGSGEILSSTIVVNVSSKE